MYSNAFNDKRDVLHSKSVVARSVRNVAPFRRESDDYLPYEVVWSASNPVTPLKAQVANKLDVENWRMAVALKGERANSSRERSFDAMRSRWPNRIVALPHNLLQMLHTQGMGPQR